MMILKDYSYLKATSLDEATGHICAGGTVIAGGSDIMPQLKTDVIDVTELVDISKLVELNGIYEDADGIHIGAGVTLATLSKDSLIATKLPAISQAACSVASPQIRNRGTLAGNLLQAKRCFYYNQTKKWRDSIPLCYKVGGDVCLQIPNATTCRAIYYSDMAPAMLLFDPQVTIETADGRQVISLTQLLADHAADVAKQMLVVDFLIPTSAYGTYSKFIKHSIRGSVDFPTINFAMKVSSTGVSLFCGAMGPGAIELTETQQYINGGGKDLEVALTTAKDELKRKCSVIREVGISVSVKRSTSSLIEPLLQKAIALV